MKFLIDESVEYSLVITLRKLGYNVSSVSEESPSLEDRDVIGLAYSEERVIITNDKDFGELIYRQKFSHKGVILFRLKSENKETKLNRLKILLEKYSDKIQGRFTVVTDSAIRFRI